MMPPNRKPLSLPGIIPGRTQKRGIFCAPSFSRNTDREKGKQGWRRQASLPPPERGREGKVMRPRSNQNCPHSAPIWLLATLIQVKRPGMKPEIREIDDCPLSQCPCKDPHEFSAAHQHFTRGVNMRQFHISPSGTETFTSSPGAALVRLALQRRQETCPKAARHCCIGTGFASSPLAIFPFVRYICAHIRTMRARGPPPQGKQTDGF